MAIEKNKYLNGEGLTQYTKMLDSRYSASKHNHNDLYYTELEMNDKLDGKSDTGHTHTPAEVGLDKLTNIPDSERKVAHAETAGVATTATLANKVVNSLTVQIADDLNAQNAEEVVFDGETPKTLILSAGTNMSVKSTVEGNKLTNVFNVEVPQIEVNADEVENTGNFIKSIKSATGHGITYVKGNILAEEVPEISAAKITSGELSSERIKQVEADKIKGGILSTDVLPNIPLDKLPAASIERVVVVDDDSARLKLTIADVLNGDTVKVSQTSKMYFVKDQKNLAKDGKQAEESAFEEYVVGKAAAVEWNGVLNKPEEATRWPKWSEVTDTNSVCTTSNSNVLGDNSTTISVTIGGTTKTLTKYSHPTHTNASIGLYKVAVDGLGHVTQATKVGKSDITSLGIPAQDTKYSLSVTNSQASGSNNVNVQLSGGSVQTVIQSIPNSEIDALFS